MSEVTPIAEPLDPVDRNLRPGECYIVGLGASAGGLDALERFFKHTSSDTGMAFVVVQHLSPDHESRMNELLARQTDMIVTVAQQGTTVQPNVIYLIPPGKNIEIRSGKLQLDDPNPKANPNLPIDIFLQSLAKDVGDRAIAVILSGTGSDGSRGIIDVDTAGGLVVVQDEDSAAFNGMPRAATATKIAGVIATPEAMPEWIARYILQPNAFPRDQVHHKQDAELVISRDAETATIFRIFREKYGIDFSYYRSSTINRRLERRVLLTGVGDLSKYLELLDREPLELESLYRDLLVEVTQFFRDRDAFTSLREHVYPLIKAAGSGGEMRVWVPGCATGEEAYSVAMMFDDCAEELGLEVGFKVFATDVHTVSLETASVGVYSPNSIATVPEKFRERYFQRVGDLYHVKKHLRQHVIFAPHDITKDPPFTRIDLITCRNVLIYFEPAIQRKVLSLFHFGMKVGGIMGLGPSETIGPLEREFEPLDRRWNIFKKIRDVRLPQAALESLRTPIDVSIGSRPSYVSTATRTDRSWVIPEAHEELLMRYVPTSLLVNEHNEVVHSFGDAQQMLIQPGGRMTLDVTKLVSRDMGTAIVAALIKVKAENQPVTFNGVASDTNKGMKQFDLRVEPFRRSTEPMFLISFEERDIPNDDIAPEANVDVADFDHEHVTAERIGRLEQELAYTRDTLQTTVEELETSNEELQSTNEELVSSNEELQSTNEELHSVNEELHTVNVEHQRKIAELTHLTADMNNLLNNNQLATIFLDDKFCIRRFTPAIQELFHIMEQDNGRPIEHIAHRFTNFDLKALIDSAVTSQEVSEVEAETKAGSLYRVHCSPHMTTESTPGVVITFVCLQAANDRQKE